MLVIHGLVFDYIRNILLGEHFPASTIPVEYIKVPIGKVEGCFLSPRVWGELSDLPDEVCHDSFMLNFVLCTRTRISSLSGRLCKFLQLG